MSNEPHKWTLEGFVEHFDFFHHKMLDHKFVWMLGAGASLASGIPLGSQLVDRWLKELHTREDGGKTPIEEWATDKSLGIDRFKYEDRASFYPKIYERRFKDYADEGYTYLESVMADADPSPGYYSILASALAGGPPERPPRHNAVVTTNFDNLVADALSIYTDTFPFVCGHESLTPFVKVAMRRPLVCKIHRDLLLAPQNDTRSLRRLHDAWGTALRSLFEHYTPLFIGYGGNDDTLMDLLESLQPGDIKGQMIWCYHEGADPSERIVNVISDHQGILVPVPDFDLLMVLLGEKMGISLLDEDIGSRAEKRTAKYRNRIQNLDTVEHPEVTKALHETFDRSGGWWVWEQKARAEADPDRREVIYRQAIQHYPKDATLLNYFALFLSWIPDRDVEAERLFRNAVAIEPNNTTLITNLASNLFCKAKSDPKEIESLFHDALEIAPESANVRTRYALFLYTFKKNLEEAEEQFRTGIQLAPEAPFPAHEYANFIMNERTYDQEADRLFQLSITDSSSNANWLCNYAGLQISRDQTGAALTTLKNAKENIQTDDGGPVWKSRVAAKISIYSAILASLQRKDPSRPLRELHNELSTGFPGLPWDVKRVLAYAKERISQEEYTMYSGLAEAFLDKAASAKAMRLIDEFNNGKRTKPRRVKTSAKGSKRKTKGISRKMINRESDEPPTDD